MYVRTYHAKAIGVQGSITLTELRQRIFQLADRVIESGEPLVIERRGVRLRLVREDAVTDQVGRLSRIKPRKQSVVVGPPLDPHESPARWTGQTLSKVAEPQATPWNKPRNSRRRSKS